MNFYKIKFSKELWTYSYIFSASSKHLITIDLCLKSVIKPQVVFSPLHIAGFQRHAIPLYLLLVYLVTALVQTLTTCLARLPCWSSLTAVWISQQLMAVLLAYLFKQAASPETLSKISFTTEFMIPMALLEMPVSELTSTCLKTLQM